MQILTFTVGGQPYAIPSRTVLEVLPLVPARPIPLLPDYVPGVFTYRGRLVPLIDLGRRFAVLAPESHARRRLSTRVIVVEFTSLQPPAGDRPSGRIRLGLIADDVVSIRSSADGDSGSAGIAIGGAPFLGSVARLGDATVQMVLVEHLLPEDLLPGIDSTTAGACDP